MIQPAGAQPLVLIVDDEPEIVDLISEQLGEDYRISVASSGEQALELFRNWRPDVVLLDIQMPGIDGIEVLQQMRALDAGVPVIMLTSSQSVERLATALKSGAFSYLPKPYELMYLKHMVAAALAQRRP